MDKCEADYQTWLRQPLRPGDQVRIRNQHGRPVVDKPRRGEAADGVVLAAIDERRVEIQLTACATIRTLACGPVAPHDLSDFAG